MRFWTVALLLSLSLCACNRPRVVWRYQTEGYVSTTPAIYRNSVIIGSHDHHLYSLDQNTGKVLWKTDLGDRILANALVDGTSVYAGTTDGTFYQLNAENGQKGWHFKAGALIEFDPCSDSEGIYFGSNAGFFNKIGRDGKLLWAAKTDHMMTSSCIFYEDLVITTSWDTGLYAFRRDTGSTAWKFSAGVILYANGVIAGDSIFLGTHEVFYKLDARSGKLLFKKDAGYNTHLLALNDFIYTQENGITKRTLEGNVVQNLPFNAFPEFKMTFENQVIVAANTTGHLYGISPDLEYVWKFKAKDKFWAPGVLHQGIYYIGNRDGSVYALKLPS